MRANAIPTSFRHRSALAVAAVLGSAFGVALGLFAAGGQAPTARAAAPGPAVAPPIVGPNRHIEVAEVPTLSPPKVEGSPAESLPIAGTREANLSFLVTPSEGVHGLRLRVNKEPVSGKNHTIRFSGSRVLVAVEASADGFDEYREQLWVDGDREIALALSRSADEATATTSESVAKERSPRVRAKSSRPQQRFRSRERRRLAKERKTHVERSAKNPEGPGGLIDL